MKKILLATHGLMAMGTYEAYKMIVGENDDVRYICLSADKGIEDFKAELNEMKDWFLDAEQIFVLTDIQSGSPYSTSINFLQENNLITRSNVIAGLNLPLLLSIAFAEDTESIEEVKSLMEDAKEGIKLFEICTTDEDDDL